MGEIWNPSSIPFLPVSHFNARSNTMKLLVLCIFIAGLAATQAKKCDLKKPECVEIFTENETEGPEGPKPKPCDCRKCQADSFCFTDCGAEVEGTRQEGPGANCVAPPKTTAAPKLKPCAHKKSVLDSSGNPYKIDPTCDENGYFSDTQCWKQGPEPGQEYCWCTQRNGKIIPGTFYVKNTKDAKPNCAAHVAVKPTCNKGDVLKPYPIITSPESTCNRYISCAPERTWTCICGEGQHFDFAKQQCGWAKDVKCGSGEE